VTDPEPDLQLRPITASDQVVLTGGDSPFDDWGPRPPDTQPPAPDLTGNGGLAVIDTASGDLLGNVSWHWVHWGPNPESANPMIGIWLRRQARGRGVGTAAQRALVARFFQETIVNRIEAHTDVENIAEQRALEKIGFTKEGVIRGAQWRQGVFRDGNLYSILRSEWAD
jgi:RimJ/RimL family protein N-acetyltransferase